ncbi:MAG: chemotaxis protein CheC [Butyrivibrio sp.]
MAVFNINEMTDMQFDVLKEIGNIGAGNAVTSLAQMMGMRIDMGVPHVSLVPMESVARVIGSEETIVAGIILGLEGDVNGMMMMLLPEASAHKIVDTMLGGMTEDGGESGFGPMAMSVLGEIGNIIAGSYLSALSTLTGLTVTATVPGITIDMAGAMLSVPAIEYGKIGDKVLLIETALGEEDFLDGYIVMVPDVESYGKILASLGIEF